MVHLHEPLAPMASYGLLLSDPLPMVGTFHRAGVSRWVPVFRPLARLVGRRLQVRVAVSEAARETGIASVGGEFEVLFNGIDMERFASPRTTPPDGRRPTVLFLGRHEARKGLGYLLDAFAMVERPGAAVVAGTGPASEAERRRHPESDRVKWLGVLSDGEVAARAGEADVLCAPSLRGESFGMVLLEGMAARCAVVASDIEGYRSAAGGHAALAPPGRRDRPGTGARRGPGRVAERSGLSSPEALKAAEVHAQGGRWKTWPIATSTSMNGPSSASSHGGRHESQTGPS